ncbi:hypothetical protein [Gordonia zhaorongruii]|uniref:hypothetical protein n=1 Tax=Gordonia zhaorongruii TaxID=2597659 RepID=UPI0010482481|nr:hypothetical protein [Gordonia zhaorongruii]
MSRRRVAVVGMPGAEPDRLAEALNRHGLDTSASWVRHRDRWSVPTDRACVVVALDVSADAGDEEMRLLHDLAAGDRPVALVATCVDRIPEWPHAVARSREVLDPGKRLALFAVAVDGADQGESGADGGVSDLAEWVRRAEPGTHVPELTALEPPFPGESALGVPGAPTPVVRTPVVSTSPDAVSPRGTSRGNRLSGLRAGLTAARADAVTATREVLQALAVTADRACSEMDPRHAAAYTDWLRRAVGMVGESADRMLAARLEQVRAAAVLGLGTGSARAEHSVPALPAPGAPLPAAPSGRAAGEDAVVLLLGATAGLGAGRMVVAPMAEWAGLGWIGTVLTVFTGVVLAAWIVGVRRAAAARTALKRWTTDTITMSRTGMEHRLAARLGAAEAHVSREIWTRTQQRRAEPSTAERPTVVNATVVHATRGIADG